MQTKFKLKDLKPDTDFVKWNDSMAMHFDQDKYYSESHPFVLWVERKRMSTITNSIRQHLNTTNQKDPMIIEVGCGMGHVLEEVASKITTKNLFGIDISESWLEKAKQKIGNKAKLMYGFAEDLPFEDNSVDYVICSEVLEHIIDPKVALNEIKRVVKASGLIIISIPEERIINKLKDIIYFFKLYNRLFPNIVKDNEWHIHHFNLKYFKELMPADLEITSIKAIPLLLLPLRYVVTLRK